VGAIELRAGCREGGEQHDVVLDEDVRPVLGDDLAQPRLAVLRTVDAGLVGRLDEGLQLFDRGLAELRCGLGDEVGPECARVLLARILGRFGEIEEFLDETERRELARPRAFGGEHDGVAAVAQDGGQADALVRRPVGRLRPEHDRQRCRRCWHGRTILPWHGPRQGRNVTPPSTLIVCAVMKLPSSDSSNALSAATSSGLPKRYLII
jgi:hypothetical protein